MYCAGNLKGFFAAEHNAPLLLTGGTGSFGHTVRKHFLYSDIGEILLHWRMFIIWMIVGAVLFGTFSYVRLDNAVIQQQHLPVDEIIVAPTADRSRVAEQIERFCRSKYWLKNVKVRESVIPYVK